MKRFLRRNRIFRGVLGTRRLTRKASRSSRPVAALGLLAIAA
jgi:hypothetical protein